MTPETNFLLRAWQHVASDDFDAGEVFHAAVLSGQIQYSGWWWLTKSGVYTL